MVQSNTVELVQQIYVPTVNITLLFLPWVGYPIFSQDVLVHFMNLVYCSVYSQ